MEDLNSLKGVLEEEDVEVIIDEDIDDENLFDNEDIEPDDLAKFTFAKHTKSVFSSDISQDSQLAVTGGEDDMAYVWSTTTGEILMECTGHKDSVTHASFNHDSQMIASGDMAGMIQVWNVKDKKLLWCFEGDDMEWLMWHPVANVLCGGFSSGSVYIWQIPQGNCKVLASPNNYPSTCGKILPNGKQIIVGYSDGQLRLWDIKETNVVWSTTDNDTITSVDINTDGSLAVVTPAAQVIKITDGKIIATLLPDGETEIESAVFHSELGILVTGSLTGLLCVWDLGKHTLRHQASLESSITVMKWGPNGILLVGTTDGAICVCDAKSLTLVETLTGHRSHVLSISVFKEGNHILSTSDDLTAKIFEIKI